MKKSAFSVRIFLGMGDITEWTITEKSVERIINSLALVEDIYSVCSLKILFGGKSVRNRTFQCEYFCG